MSSSSLRLSAVLVGHSGDVKAVAAASATSLSSASRDRTVRLWLRTDSKAYTCTGTITAHQAYVNSVAIAPATPTFPQGLVVSGGADNVIFVHLPSDLERPVWTLVGHTGNVCALAIHHDAQTGQLVLLSGSWDNTARVWDLHSGACLETLQGHTQAVWAVAAVGTGQWLTGAADKTIKLWAKGACVRNFTGHTDSVRSIAIIPGVGFASASNDSTLRVWTLDGSCIQELMGHTAYVYSLAYVAATGELISGGEDRSLRVWRDGSCVQTILHPAESVWSVAALPNGDVATGCNDGIFDDQVRSFSIASESIDPKHVHGIETLSQPGRKDGEVKMIRNNNIIEAHQWSAAQGQWVKVGEVTNVRKDTKKVFEGVEYDYVFDVDIGDDQPVRKLPYNLTENPYTAAQLFINREQLSQEHLDTVAKFIIKNTEHAMITQQQQPVAFDPYTGSSRYAGGAPMTGTASGTAPSNSADPFAFSGAYTTSAVKPPTSVAPVPTPSSPEASSVIQTQYILLESGNFNAVHQKMLQFNSELAQSETTQALAISEQDKQSLALMVETVTNVSRYHATSLFENQFLVLEKAFMWPPEKRFPALDFMRLAILHPSCVQHYASSLKFEQKLLDVALVSSQVTDGGAGNEINQMFGFRTLVNLCKSTQGRAIVQNHFDQITEAIEGFPMSTTNKNLHQALSSLLLNLSVMCNEKPTLATKRPTMIVLVMQELANQNIDDDVALRLFVATATLALGQSSVAAIVKQQGLASYAKFFSMRTNPRLKVVIEQLAPLYQ